MALAQLGGYGFVYLEDSSLAGQAIQAAPAIGNVSISFRGESYSRALNSTLLAAGLQGKKEGNMIFAGRNALSKSFGPQLSKVYRLNQVNANSAADYLANLGASVTKTNTVTTAVTQGVAQGEAVSSAANSQTTQSSTQTTVEAYGAASGPLVGLRATTDTRLSTITLVGDSSLVIVAEQYLRQLDLRQRQVALSVQILDVTLENDSAISNSFAFKAGNSFIVNDAGSLIGATGSFLPPTGDQFNTISGGAGNAKPIFGDTANQGIIPPLAPAPVNPGTAYSADNFYNLVKATIQSRSTKILASPTLILSEESGELAGGAEVAATVSQSGGGSAGATIGRPRANESFVTVGEQVITNYTVSPGQNGAPNSCQPQFGISGLTLGAKVLKIDDNGFVTFAMSPSVTASTRTQRVENCGFIDILAVRRLDTGNARIRDGQTLILTGVISDSDTQAVQKWPILGDIPFIGQFFRGSAGGRDKRELVIMVTPRILSDGDGGGFGYGYQPSTPQAREFMGSSSY
ncbi:type II secretion system protein GspD [Cyanobium sp. T1B-Tous]|uniref:type II secretion system protein GspD n=1 Tax=Cyanobium sp. T1B-Tous TaxID=2823721 RepID=UPI0020CF1B78|nr:type II and III secretion system protein [Cyanobium sp. T1B-Tous]